MKRFFAAIAPLGVHINADTVPCGKRIRARARWTDPVSGIRESRSITVDNKASAYEFFRALRSHVGADLDRLITLTDYAHQIGDRFLRGVDMTSTAAGYRAGLWLRALPALGRLCVRDITSGIVDRSIDRWEIEHSRSTLKNTIAALTRVLDEAVRDEIITRNPVRDRAHRRYRMRETPHLQTPIPSPTDIGLIAAACAEAHQSYGDHVILSAFLAARTSEVAGCQWPLRNAHGQFRMAANSRARRRRHRLDEQDCHDRTPVLPPCQRPQHQASEGSSSSPGVDH